MGHLSMTRQAQEHIKAGGCSGDVCGCCGGKGYTWERTDRGTLLNETCYRCYGTGMRS